METLSAVLALWEGNPPAIGGFPSQKVGDALRWFVVKMDKLLNKQSSCLWFDVPDVRCGRKTILKVLKPRSAEKSSEISSDPYIIFWLKKVTREDQWAPR